MLSLLWQNEQDMLLIADNLGWPRAINEFPEKVRGWVAFVADGVFLLVLPDLGQLQGPLWILTAEADSQEGGTLVCSIRVEGLTQGDQDRAIAKLVL